MPNFGDEFITRAWLDWLARHHPDVPVWLDCIEPGRASHLFQDAHPRLRTTNTLWHLAFAGAGPSLSQGADYVGYLVRELGSPRFDAGLEFLRSVRSVHLVGGGYLNALWPHQLLLLPALAALHTEFGVPIHATGQGLMPVAEHGADVVQWTRMFSTFEVRDRASAELLSTDTGIDDAFLAFMNPRPVFAEEPAPDVMLLLQGDFAESYRDSLLDQTLDFVAALPSGVSVGVAESLPPDDGWLIRALETRGVRVEAYPFLRLWKGGFPGRSGQSWLTSRFHFHLLAAASGASGTAVSTHPDYYGVKHGSLLDLGTGWSFADAAATRLPSPHRSAQFSQRATLKRLGGQKAEIARSIYG
ncbi:polysaccharide pyruvyl transferase family protein [Microbacterium aurantiacum]|uniref:polysaccharide pyruvyl transferase family protein n=1 Tax=Microbacterium aurantiacum TaxID=162393 RepID=UPI003D75A572